ncbi:zinc finger protein 431-like [Vespula squamosa]|uniref:Zinc finger protein 431-like n=1 Tax=Vespula squamosa TaxID=30214 RepID=A0ABD2AHY6_VESSQ
MNRNNNNNNNNNHNNNNNNNMSLTTPPAIHVGPIITPGSNETISIVIPLSAQLATVSGQKVEKVSCKDCGKDAKQRSPNGAAPRIRNDKTKGCPYPTCTRYGRAFSRAHDLKRHIARHEMRKEKLMDGEKGQLVIGCLEYAKNLVNDSALRTNESFKTEIPRDTEANVRTYMCPRCKKRYSEESKFKAHLAMHDKVIIVKTMAKNVCTLCGLQLQNEADMQEHMKQHAGAILQTQSAQSMPQNEKEDDFLLEEMLLLHKNPRRTSSSDKTVDVASGKVATKIRCDYCSKTFKTKWTLSSHVAAHEGRYQFDCAQCGKKFVRKSHYEGHVRSHEAARPYVCEQCGKTFKELKHRREHTKRKHPGNQSAIQNLLDSISPCASEEVPVDQAKFTLLMPVNFTA